MVSTLFYINNIHIQSPNEIEKNPIKFNIFNQIKKLKQILKNPMKFIFIKLRISNEIPMILTYSKHSNELKTLKQIENNQLNGRKKIDQAGKF